MVASRATGSFTTCFSDPWAIAFEVNHVDDSFIVHGDLRLYTSVWNADNSYALALICSRIKATACDRKGNSGDNRGLKFGRKSTTPAMQAGLTRRWLTFREVFETGIAFLASQNVIFAFSTAPFLSVTVRRMRLAG